MFKKKIDSTAPATVAVTPATVMTAAPATVMTAAPANTNPAYIGAIVILSICIIAAVIYYFNGIIKAQEEREQERQRERQQRAKTVGAELSKREAERKKMFDKLDAEQRRRVEDSVE